MTSYVKDAFRLVLTATLIPLVVVIPGCARTDSPSVKNPIVTTDAELAENIKQLAEQLAAKDEFTGVVMLSRNHQVLFRSAFGIADRNSGRMNTPETPFALASVSKMFTAVVVAQLAEQKKVTFESTIGSLLPNYPAPQSHVTVGQLLTMSSGIPDLFRNSQFWDQINTIRQPTDFWRFFATAPLEFEPGTKWTYSNSNFLVLGAIVEKVTSRPFTTMVEENVFHAAGMKQTGYRTSAVPTAAIGYTRTRPGATEPQSKEWYPAWDTPETATTDGDSDFLVGAPMGGGMSTAEDLTRFAQALMEGRLLSREMANRVMTGVIPADYDGRDGYGFETRLYDGRVRIVGHRGGFTGVTNQVEFYPNLGYVVVVLGNSDPSGAETIAKRIRVLIGESPVLSRPR